MLKRVVIFILLIIYTKYTCAQITIKYNGKEIDYATCGVKYALLNATSFTDSVLQTIDAGVWKNLNVRQPKISYIPQTTWLKIPFKAIGKYGRIEYIDVINPHINYLKCWILQHDTIVKNFNLTGDNLPHKTRPLPTTSFVFPVNDLRCDSCEIIIATDKRYTKLDLPVNFCSVNYYIRQSNIYELIFGVISGFCLFLFLFNLYLFITSKQGFYFWYCCYMLLILIYITANAGILFKYIIPLPPSFNDFIRPIAISLVELPLLLFFLSLLNIKTSFPRLHFYTLLVIGGYILAFLIALLSLNFGGVEIHGTLLYISSYVVPSFLLYSILLAGYFVIKKVNFSIFALCSFLVFTSLIMVYSLQQKEIIPNNFFTSNASYWAILSEASIATFLLAWQYKYYRDQAKKLLTKNLQLQQEIFKETAAWQEKELLRLSGILHDTVGATLGLLRLEADNMELTPEGKNTIANRITHIGNEVRTMSHTFSPFVLKNKGLYTSIQDTVKSINESSNIELQFEWVGHRDKIGLQLEVVIHQIVQELLQNMLKHSKANIAFLQILEEQHVLSIYYEDDGIGFDTNNKHDGIGLKNIENLITLLKGQCRIQSKEGEGFTISIEFNTINHEST